MRSYSARVRHDLLAMVENFGEGGAVRRARHEIRLQPTWKRDVSRSRLLRIGLWCVTKNVARDSNSATRLAQSSIAQSGAQSISNVMALMVQTSPVGRDVNGLSGDLRSALSTAFPSLRNLATRPLAARLTTPPVVPMRRCYGRFGLLSALLNQWHLIHCAPKRPKDLRNAILSLLCVPAGGLKLVRL